MKSLLAVAVFLVLQASAAHAASGRYSCTPGKHALMLDFGRKIMTLDGDSAAMTEGVVTWRGEPGGRLVIVAPPEKTATRIFDVSIDQGRDYSGFVICKAN